MSREEYKDAIEVSVIFHEGQKMFAVPKQPAQQEPVAKDNSNYRLDPPGLDPSHQKPVAWWIPKAKQFCLPSSDGTRPFAKAWKPLYTSPPAQRTWVGLTDDEKRQLFERKDYQGWLDYINAIEAKLKEKNT